MNVAVGIVLVVLAMEQVIVSMGWRGQARVGIALESHQREMLGIEAGVHDVVEVKCGLLVVYTSHRQCLCMDTGMVGS